MAAERDDHARPDSSTSGPTKGSIAGDEMRIALLCA
jgi:hypothetical protein